MTRRALAWVAVAAALIIGLAVLPVGRAADGGAEVPTATAQKVEREYFVDVRDYGAIGDGKHDDTRALQAAIDAAGQKQSDNQGGKGLYRVHIPAGTYRITDTLKLGRKHSSIVIEGAGNGKSAPSKLFWEGEAGGTMIDAEACWGLMLNHLWLAGSRRFIFDRYAKGNAGLKLEELHAKYKVAGLLLRINSLQGHVAAEYLFDTVTLLDAVKGVEIGGNNKDLCGSDMTIKDLGLRDLMVGFETLKGQNVNFTFIRPEVGNCGIGLHFAGGGSVIALQYSGWKCDRFIKIGGTGINNGNFYFVGMKPELYRGPTTGRRGVILEAAGGETVVTFKSLCSGCISLFDSDKHKSDREHPMFILGPGAQVSVEGSLLSGKLAKLTGRKDKSPAWIQFDNCRFRVAADPRQQIEHDEWSGFEVRNSIVVEDTRENRHIFLKSYGKYPPHAATE